MNCVGVWNVVIWGRYDVWGGWIMFRAGHQKEFKTDGSGMANGKSQLKKKWVKDRVSYVMFVLYKIKKTERIYFALDAHIDVMKYHYDE